MTTPIYLDHAASTPALPEVVEAMVPWLHDHPGNPSSQHSPGRAAAEAVEVARRQIASLVGANDEDLTFTSGATESCNLALKGLLRPRLGRGESVHIVASAIEHPAVLDPLRRLEREGATVDLVPPTAAGIIDPDELQRRLTDDTAMVSVMWVNNELGTINDIGSIGACCRDRSILFHCDATQAVGKLHVDLASIPVDAVSVSGHKLHGPKGVGGLILQGRAKGRPIEPLIEGGGHERGLRSGTLNVPAIVGFGQACHLAARSLADEAARVTTLRDALERALMELPTSVSINGRGADRVPHIINLTAPSASPEPLAARLHGIACSRGSACGSARGEPSHVLRSIGLDDAAISQSIRLSLGRTTTEADITGVIEALSAAL